MSNPRKFSEKIALHTQKQAEGTAAFEAILREVSETTKIPHAPNSAVSVQQNRQPDQLQQQQQQQMVNNIQMGRSLPNVNQMAARNSIDLKSALCNLADIKQAMVRGRMVSSEQLNRDGRSQSQPRRLLPLITHRDISPYKASFLSAPNDSSWRRASSDSAIHSRVVSGDRLQSHFGGSGSTLSNYSDEAGRLRVVDKERNCSDTWDPRYTVQEQMKGRACHLPGINISLPMSNVGSGGGDGNARAGEQGATDEGTSGGIHHFPVISMDSTGSLPDLTTINFSSPLYPTLQAGIAGVWGGGGVPSSGGNRGGGGPVLPTRVQRNSAPAPLVLTSSNYWSTGNTLSPDVVMKPPHQSAGDIRSSSGGVFNLSPISPSISINSSLSATSLSPKIRVSAVHPSAAINTPPDKGGGGGGGASQQLLLQIQRKLLQQYQQQQLPQQLIPLQISQQPSANQKQSMSTELSIQQLTAGTQMSPLAANVVPSFQVLPGQDLTQQELLKQLIEAQLLQNYRQQQVSEQQSSSFQPRQQPDTNVHQQQAVHQVQQVKQGREQLHQLLQEKCLQQQRVQQQQKQQQEQLQQQQQHHQQQQLHQHQQQQQQHHQQQLQQQQHFHHHDAALSNNNSNRMFLSNTTQLSLSPGSQTSNQMNQGVLPLTDSHPQSQDGQLYQSDSSLNLGQRDSSGQQESQLTSFDAESEQLLLQLLSSGLLSAEQFEQWGIPFSEISGAISGDGNNSATAGFFNYGKTGGITCEDTSSSNFKFEIPSSLPVGQFCLPTNVNAAGTYGGNEISTASVDYQMAQGGDVTGAGCQSPVDPASTTSDPLNTRAYLGDSFEDFSAEDALRLGLDPLASEELEMLDDPSVITDAATEDMFRLDQDYWKPS